MKTLLILTRRNAKLFFKDKGMFFSSLITPAILLVLYVSFLSSIYRRSFVSALPSGFTLSESIIDGVVAGQLASSLLAVCCVTIAFCSNLIMIQDKVTGSVRDLTVTPVKRSVLAMGYFSASAAATLIVCLATCGLCFLYTLSQGWYLSGADIALILLDVLLLTLFGTALSSCLHYFLTTQGQMSAVGTLVGAGYGFICGAYMPIANFPDGLQKVLSFLPGTYATSLLHNHWMRGALGEMGESGVPVQVLDAIRDSIDCNIYFFGKAVSQGAMYLILAGSVVLVTAVYVLINVLCRPRYGDR
jgi:multidrug/hemolysin transport system permease protein